MTTDTRSPSVQTAPVPRLARLRGLAALLALLAAVAGVPAALLFLGQGLPLDPSVLTPEALLRPDDGRLLILVLYAIGWLAWGAFTVSVSVEIVAVARGIPAPTLRGVVPIQRLAAALVASTALLAVAPPASVEAKPVAAVTSSLVTPAAPTQADIKQRAVAQDSAHQDLDAHGPAHPTITVRRHDTLWSLAERHLGDGARYTEILDLNRGVPQSDGRRLENPSWLYPGWVLRLPVDARATDQPARAAATGDVVVVQPGDTLWEIAEDELGDGTRYSEVFRENIGDPQPDGRALTDPNVILVGWELEIPRGQDSVEGATTDAPTQNDQAPVEPVPAPTDAVGDSEVRAADDAPTRATTPAEPPATTDPPQAQTDAPQRAGSEAQPGSAPEDDEGADALDADSAVPSAGLIALGIGGIALAGFVGEVARRRRYQQSVRKVGQRIPLPDGEAAAVETQARALADLPRSEVLSQALRALAESARQAGRPLPDVRVIRITADGVELTLGHDEGPLAPFIAGEGVWALDRVALEVAYTGSIDPYPGLVTVGADGDDVILLNLESVGGLAVVGEEDAAVDAATRAAAADLALTPRASTVLLDGVLGDLAAHLDPGRVTVSTDSAHLDRLVGAHERLVHQQLGEGRDVDLRHLRVDGDTEVTRGCLVVVSSTSTGDAPRPWQGVARVQSGVFRSGPAETLRLRPDGMADLVHAGLVVQPARLPEGVAASLAHTLALADQPSLPGPEAAPALDATTDAPTTPPGGPRVLLLGRVAVVDVAGKCPEQRIARLTEAVAYLWLHPEATREELAEAIWAGRRVEQSTKWNLVSRIRTWLGVDDDGQHYLQTVLGHGVDRLRLSPGVTSDWQDFVRLAEAGMASPGPEGARALHQALDLVRGRPFLGIDPRRYAWAEADIQHMVSLIVDCAVESAERDIVSGDAAKARETATRILAVDTANERLAELAMRACQMLGDGEAAQRLLDRYESELRALEPESDTTLA